MGPGGISTEIAYVLGQTSGLSKTPADVFETVYLVFLILGTLVGIVVIGYTLTKAYRYRDDGKRDDKSESDKKVVRPVLGHLPAGSGGGKKLFVSFGISAVIVLSLIVWTYSALLFVDDTPPEVEAEGEEPLEIDVVGKQFNWEYTYPNNHTEEPTLYIPADRPIRLEVTSADVWHNYGINEFRVKSDAIPGQTTTAWFVAEETGTYEAVCYELCGSGHSAMRGDVVVMEQEKFQDWYANTTDGSTSGSVSSDVTADTDANADAETAPTEGEA
ncbi:MAG: cytochrome c oxidase subunit II [Halobacteriales archaeon SW_9_67_25]|nr:MAG: cytochrome c oxidase subunit II [Halobacteriales archaeon SW_9_67_25]